MSNGAILFDKTYTTNLPAENIVLIPTVGLMPLETVSKIQRFYCADLYANVYKVAPSPAILCNSCNPQLARTFTVTISSLPSPWTDGNGTHTVTWDTGCTWYDSGRNIQMIWDASSGKWFARYWRIADLSTYLVHWENGSTDACDPIADYGTITTCASSDPSDCSGLVGTTSCIVSA